MVFRTLIADDEEPSRARLARMLEKYSDVELVAQAANGQETLAAVSQLKPHLLFLDIQMPAPNGLEVAADLSEEEDPPFIVFLTAFSEHALEAFDLDALDYLVKPVRRERLSKTIKKVRMASRDRNPAAETNSSTVGVADSIALQDPDGEARKVVSLLEIEYFSTRDELCFAAVGGKEFTLSSTLTSLQETLPPSLFLRTHRAYIVNLKKIDKVTPWFHRSYNLHLKDGTQIPLSRSYAPAFRKRVNWF